jgi:hypothetical protein
MKRGAALLLGLVLFGCSQTVALRETPEAPAAIGQAKISTDDNNNTRIELKIEHLAPPQNLTPPKSVYVVWAEPPDGKPINLGQVVVGQDRDASFETVTPLKVFRVFLTAEDRPLPDAPSPQVVVATDVFRATS